MDPSVWGPSTWKSLHAIAAHCDTTGDVDTFWSYLLTLSGALPCDSCRKHMKEYLHANPRPDSNMFEYTVHFHNAVNRRLGKPIVAAEDARVEFSKVCTSTCDGSSSSGDRVGVVVLYVTMMISTLLIFLFLRRTIKSSP